MVSPSAGATPRRLTQTNPPAGDTDELPMWSGDGRWILFVRTKPAGISAGGTLYALDPFGGNLVGPIASIGRTGNYYGSYNWPFQLDWHR
jgi:WD40 repeat protein